jgi:hypothetical protein
MDVKFTDFDLRSPLLTSDYIVGYKQDASTEYRATVKTLIDTVQAVQVVPQELSFNSGNNNLSITQGNTVSLSSLVDKLEVCYFSWVPDTDFNLPTSTDYAPPFNTTQFNTNTNIFELVNSNQTSPAARVFIKEPGYYEFFQQLFTYDLKNNYDYTFKILTSPTSTGSFSLVRVTSKKRYGENNDTPDTSVETTTLIQVPTTGYYTVTMNAATFGPFTNRTYSISNNIPTMSLMIKRLRGL